MTITSPLELSVSNEVQRVARKRSISFNCLNELNNWSFFLTFRALVFSAELSSASACCIKSHLCYNITLHLLQFWYVVKIFMHLGQFEGHSHVIIIHSVKCHFKSFVWFHNQCHCHHHWPLSWQTFVSQLSLIFFIHLFQERSLQPA